MSGFHNDLTENVFLSAVAVVGGEQSDSIARNDTVLLFAACPGA